MIEPYLFGTLSPEDEVAFERQLSRDPALTEATSRLLNAEAALAGISGFDTPSRQRSPGRALLLLVFVVIVAGLFWWKTRSTESRPEVKATPSEVRATRSSLLDH